MAPAPLVYAPDDIFKKKAEPVAAVDDDIRALVDSMFETLYLMRGVGMAAPMVGVLKRIIIIDLQQDGVKLPMACINPEITWRSDTMQEFEEASLCFPGISAPVTRPNAVTLKYTDRNGTAQSLDAKGFLATVIQHEVDYLDGRVFLDYLSRLKRDMLVKKMLKYKKTHL